MHKFVWSVVLTIALAACVSNPPVTPPPNQTGSFSLTLEPAAFKIGPASEVSAVVSVARNGGFTEAVQLSLENLPADITASFDPNPTTGDTSTLRLSSSKTSSARMLNLSLKGLAGALQASTNATLEITNALPAPSLTVDTGNADQRGRGQCQRPCE